MKPVALAALLTLPLCALPAPLTAQAAPAQTAPTQAPRAKATRQLATQFTIPARGGNIKVTPLFHATMEIEYHGKVFLIDPTASANYATAKKADFVLITHAHADHFDADTIDKLRKGRVFAPQAVVDAIRKETGNGSALSRGLVALNNGAHQSLGDAMAFDVVPAYNLQRGPQPDKRFHPKGWGNGYVLALGGKRIYIAGDTEAIPEMRRLKNIDVAFLPMNLPYTMTPQEAAGAARAFKPKVAIPYHYRYPFDKPNTNPQQFEQALRGSGVTVYLLKWYP